MIASLKGLRACDSLRPGPRFLSPRASLANGADPTPVPVGFVDHAFRAGFEKSPSKVTPSKRARSPA